MSPLPILLLLFLLQPIMSGPSENSLEEDEDVDQAIAGTIPIPNHEFKFKDVVGQTGKYKGIKWEFVTLSCPPWEFKQKTKSDSDGQEVFICVGCDAIKKTVSCTAFKTVTDPLDPTKDQYSIFNTTWPGTDQHVCVPSGYADSVDRCRRDMFR